MLRLLFVLIFALPISCLAQNNIFLEFDQEEIHLGKITKGEKIDSVFSFTNVSEEDVSIELVSTCECTKANWPKSIIKPGEVGNIPFTFDSNEKDTEEEISLDVYLKNVNSDGNPVIIFLYYKYNY
ncbi:MAG: DUF1573 domain-containing protein [Saprospiraceae bacterium]